MRKIVIPIFLMLISTFVFGQYRSYDKRGINVFERPKTDTTRYDGVKVKIGGGFTQQFQTLRHSNTATPLSSENTLVGISTGFDNAVANLNFDVLLGDGIRLNLVTYLSSRHHRETWVKAGYLEFDRLPFLKSALFDDIMQYVRIKAGHMEINYGDAHFRRSDNGNSIYNPFIENNIMDAFTTEIGMEIDFLHKGFIAVVGIGGGEIKGDISEVPSVESDDVSARRPSFLGKIGFDKQLNDDVRLRVTLSAYHTKSSNSNTLYGGDRAGSHYYGVMETGLGTSEAFSGRFNPRFSDKVTACMGNIFLKVSGLEFFGTFETAKGRSRTETSQRTADQFAGDLLYRFGKNENFYLGTRYNTVSSEMAGLTEKVKINRFEVGGGWFLTKNILIKGEYVTQKYKNFDAADIRAGGEFDGLVFEAVVGF